MRIKPFRASERALRITYAIRDLVSLAEKVKRESGEEILYLNIGDPLKYDFKVPQHMQDAICKAVKEGFNFYAHSIGLAELREAIVKREKRDNGIDISPEDVLVTNGTAEAIMAVLAALRPGDEILVPSPTYPPYISAAEFFEIKPIEYRTIEEEGWIPDIDDIRKKISEKTRAIVIINPNNPTGALYDEKIVKEIIDIAGEHSLFIISDEIYDKIVFEGSKAPNAAKLAGDVPTLVFYGLSKVYLATGWRIGYVYRWDPDDALSEIWRAMIKYLMVRISGFTPAQRAAIAALLGPQDHIKELVNKLRERRDYAYKRLNEINGISVQKPRGAFYLFPRIDIPKYKGRDKDFVVDLLKEEKVLVVHGSGFGSYGKDHFRMVFLPPIEMMREALERIERFVKKVKER
ncbi:MAG: aminotransferase class I/II-fold pyridoxal phosphate-dependent enzyme [Candidatus Njordarchaeales archaeon]